MISDEKETPNTRIRNLVTNIKSQLSDIDDVATMQWANFKENLQEKQNLVTVLQSELTYDSIDLTDDAIQKGIIVLPFGVANQRAL